jgi:hypothetical protein
MQVSSGSEKPWSENIEIVMTLFWAEIAKYFGLYCRCIFGGLVRFLYLKIYIALCIYQVMRNMS